MRWGARPSVTPSWRMVPAPDRNVTCGTGPSVRKKLATGTAGPFTIPSMGARASVGILFGTITLMALGVVLASGLLGRAVPVGAVLVRYWPVLIILWGLTQLAAYLRFRWDGSPRPVFSGSEAALLAAVIVAGTSLTAAARLSPDVGWFLGVSHSVDFFDLIGHRFEFNERHQASVVERSRIEIRNAYGDVSVRSSRALEIVLDVQKNVRAAGREEARRLAETFAFSIQGREGSYRIESNRQQLSADKRRRFKSNLAVHVPRGSSVAVTNRHGSITLDDLSGDVTVENRFGGIVVRGIGGRVRVSGAYGRASVENVSRDLSVSHEHGRVSVRNPRGPVTLTNRHGDIRLSFDEPPRHSLSISGRSSDVTIRFPSTSQFTLESRTPPAAFYSNFDGIERFDSDRGQRAVGRVGNGGPHMTIETTGGAVRLEKAR